MAEADKPKGAEQPKQEEQETPGYVDPATKAENAKADVKRLQEEHAA